MADPPADPHADLLALLAASAALPEFRRDADAYAGTARPSGWS
jgi:hypothetical protein